jgi:L-glutamine-phosphate cytidylyltransferase
MDEPLSDAETLVLDPNGWVLDLGRKPRSYDEVQGQYMGLIKVSKKMWPQIRKLYHGLDRNAVYDGKQFDQMFMTSFLREMIHSGMGCLAVPVSGGWLEIDTPSDLELLF